MHVKRPAILGASLSPNGHAQFLVWAPKAPHVDLLLLGDSPRTVPMTAGERGYFSAMVDRTGPGTRYLYQIEGANERPDPASRYQPKGVHGPSEVVSDQFDWTDAHWTGIPLNRYVIYELHVGAFTEAGTFEAVIGRLPELKELGVTAIELMPVAQFPGSRNWGYDGVCPFAVQNSYGGPIGLKRLVDASHRVGMAVVLDVVYNHLGPEGNNLDEFGPYFTEMYRTPWGRAFNFDGPDSDEVRRFFIESALRFVDEFHIDALRLDAVDAIVDLSARPFVQELADAVHTRASDLGRLVHVIGESDQNDPRLLWPRSACGHGLDAQWSDDLHHALHALMTGERSGYYEDFGRVADLAKAFRTGFVYTGEYSQYRRRRHGSSPHGLSGVRFVVGAQNHDQVGNRLLGERLSSLVSFEALKLAAGVVLLSPFVPLLFMGEEYGETAPFQYFVSHSDAELVEAVREGRRREFSAFKWVGELPDPQDEATATRSRINWDLQHREPHRTLRRLYRDLLGLRAGLAALADVDLSHIETTADDSRCTLVVRRRTAAHEALALFNFSDRPASLLLPDGTSRWRLSIHSAERQWRGPCDDAEPRELPAGSMFEVGAEAFALLVREGNVN
ncbi:MAG: malto-oligosyltrehalose trehalohydrolase [Chloroflexi bacterium]|nr:malto-oligosyltrehalose trehalohydrolase [Chloroflexota bacterium]